MTSPATKQVCLSAIPRLARKCVCKDSAFPRKNNRKGTFFRKKNWEKAEIGITQDRVNQRVQHYEIFLKKTSLGVRKLSFSLGLALIFFLILAIFPSVTVLMSVPFGIYWRTSLLAFSMAPFCHAQ